MQRLSKTRKEAFKTTAMLLAVIVIITFIGFTAKQIQDQRQAQKETIEEQSQTIQKQANKLDEQGKTIEDQSKTLDTLQKQIDEAKDVISDIQAENKALKGDLDSLKEENNDLNSENADLKKKISIAEQQKKANATNLVSNSSAKPVYTSTGKTLKVEASAYIAMCSEGCTGKTATGLDIRYSTPKIIAVDPKVIPLGTKVEIIDNGKSMGIYTAADTGGAIKGHKIDILMKTERQANNFGRHTVEVKILKKPTAI